jgi:hypothetical protein
MKAISRRIPRLTTLRSILVLRYFVVLDGSRQDNTTYTVLSKVM